MFWALVHGVGSLFFLVSYIYGEQVDVIWRMRLFFLSNVLVCGVARAGLLERRGRLGKGVWVREGGCGYKSGL